MAVVVRADHTGYIDSTPGAVSAQGLYDGCDFGPLWSPPCCAVLNKIDDEARIDGRPTVPGRWRERSRE